VWRNVPLECGKYWPILSITKAGEPKPPGGCQPIIPLKELLHFSASHTAICSSISFDFGAWRQAQIDGTRLAMLGALRKIIKRHPRLVRVLRPIIDSPSSLRGALIANAVRWRKKLSTLHLPTMHAAAAGGRRSRGIGSNASGREIVMLVVISASIQELKGKLLRLPPPDTA
jgi:hypothetical protein